MLTINSSIAVLLLTFTTLSLGLSSQNAKIIASDGLDERGIAIIVKNAREYESSITMTNTANGRTVDVKIEGEKLLTLDLSKGTIVTVSAEGSDENEAVSILATLLETLDGPYIVENGEAGQKYLAAGNSRVENEGGEIHTTTYSKSTTITAKTGLQDRLAQYFVKKANEFQAAITLTNDDTGETGDGKKLFKVLILDLICGSAVTISAVGDR